MAKNPEWTWYIVWYFFVGGVAAGAYVLAAMADFFGREEDRRLARMGYAVAFPLALICAILLTLDLGMPGRTFNMFRMFRLGSPMSVGSWALLGFGLASAISLGLALRDRPGDLRIRKIVAVPGGLLGFFIASYTGVLLGATNRPVWAGSNWIGPLFLVSAFSTGLAVLVLLRARRAGLRRLHLTAIGVEALVLILFLASLGAGAVAFLGGSFAPLFWGGVVVAGLVLPAALALPRVAGALGPSAAAMVGGVPALEGAAAVLILVGGFVLRLVVLAAGQA